jgi:hypothetical protein
MSGTAAGLVPMMMVPSVAIGAMSGTAAAGPIGTLAGAVVGGAACGAMGGVDMGAFAGSAKGGAPGAVVGFVGGAVVGATAGAAAGVAIPVVIAGAAAGGVGIEVAHKSRAGLAYLADKAPEDYRFGDVRRRVLGIAEPSRSASDLQCIRSTSTAPTSEFPVSIADCD